jgi:hypothetical protein
LSLHHRESPYQAGMITVAEQKLNQALYAEFDEKIWGE